MNEAISVIIPVYREQQGIHALLHDLISRNDPALEIIIVDGSPDQETIQSVSVEAICAASSPGRANQMNHGARLARGEILLFLHADTLLPASAFRHIRSALSNPSIAGGAFTLAFSGATFGTQFIAWCANIRSRWTRVPYGDQGLFVRKTVFETIGGFRAIDLMEDLEFMTRIKRHGYTIRILPWAVSTSDRRYRKEGILFCTLRNWTIRLAYHLGIAPKILARWYRRHD